MINKLILILAFAVVACSDPAYVASDLSRDISAELKKSDHSSIDFAVVAGSNWSQVCFFGPYNESSAEALGFEWDVGDYTDVLHSDAHNVIVFATSNEVVEYAVHSRGNGDFSGLSGQCFPRDAARFVNDPASGQWVAVEPAKT